MADAWRNETLFDCRPTLAVRLTRWLTSRRLRPVWILLVALPVMFGLQRGLLAWLSRADLTGESAAAVARAMVVGLRYDLRATAYAMIPLAPLLCLAPATAFSRRWLQSLVAAYVAAVVALALTVCIVDGFFFLVRDARMNSQVPN